MNNMKILLIQPPKQDLFSISYEMRYYPLALAYLASMVRKDHDVKIIDSNVESYDFDDIANEIKKYNPDLIGISSYTVTIKGAYRIAERAKNINENVKIVIGGAHATALPIKTMEECPYIDFIVIAEGEYTFKELVDEIKGNKEFKKIKGLVFRKKNKIIVNQKRQFIKNLDELPFPSLDLLPMEKYDHDTKNVGMIQSSRGCPSNCIFCSASLAFGKKWRAHSGERVSEEISNMVENFGINGIIFYDDNFTLNKKRLIKIIQKMKDEKMQLPLAVNSRVDNFSKDVAKELSNIDDCWVLFGIESGSQKTLNQIGKNITLEKSRKAVKNAKFEGLKVFGNFIIGFPFENKYDIKKTIKFSKKLDLDQAEYSIATPLPGSKFWYDSLEDNQLLSMNWDLYTCSQPIVKSKYLSPSQITGYMYLAYLNFYINPKKIIDDLSERKGRYIKTMLGFLNPNKNLQKLI